MQQMISLKAMLAAAEKAKEKEFICNSRILLCECGWIVIVSFCAISDSMRTMRLLVGVKYSLKNEKSTV
jgi:hypothetical protein